MKLPIFFIRGYPGVGKSTLLETLPQVHLIDPDTIDIPISIQNQVSPEIYRYRVNCSQALALINKYESFIWQQCWSKISGIYYTTDFLSRSKLIPNVNLLPIFIEVTASPYLCYRRHLNSKKTLTRKLTLESYLNKYIVSFDRICLRNAEYYTIPNQDIPNTRALHEILLKYLNLRV